jgi:UDP-4-amino-4,6-dideoxy-N-acetyl-beta-L-altrosamine N-acetyltransferase
MFIRAVNESDLSLILQWRNSNVVRENSLKKEVIQKNEHERWFKKALEEKNRFVYIASEEKKKIGVLSFLKIDDHKSEVSIYLNPDMIGLGYGTRLLKQGVENYLLDYPKVKKITATILKDNIPSIKTFEKCGFKKTYFPDSLSSLNQFSFEIEL